MSDNQAFKMEPRDLSLVELGAILVERKYWFFLTTALILVVLLLGYFQREEQAQYLSLYQVPKTEEGKDIGEPEVVAHQVTMDWAPELVEDQNGSGKWKAIDLLASYVKESSMIRVESKAPVHKKGDVIELHRTLLSKIDQSFADAVEIRKKRIESQLESISDIISMLQNKNDAAEAIAFAMGKKMDLRESLDSMTPGHMVSVGYALENANGVSVKALVLLGVVAALVIGLAVSFIVEFIARVRLNVRESARDSQ